MKVVESNFGNQCCEFKEEIEIETSFSKPLMDKIGMITFVDSNHGHNKVTGNTGLISLSRSVPVN